MSSCPKGTILYQVKPGDTFFNLARRFNTTIRAITAVNPGIDPGNLTPGQSICIPVRRSIVLCPPGNRYVIKAGDTFSKLAKKYGMTVSAIIRMNPGVDPLNLQVGQVICLPARRRRSK